MYQVGDSIFYPMHGAGVIKGLEEKEISGEKQQYFVISMIIDNMKVMIPKNKILKTNIRPVKDLAAVKNIAKMFQRPESDETVTWKKRHKVNTDKIKTGSLEACAEVVYELLRIQKEDKLNSSEKVVLNQAQKFLMSELKLIEGMNESKTEEFLSRLAQEEEQLSMA